MVATKRRFDPNLQRVRVNLGGKAQRAYVCTRCLKAGKVTRRMSGWTAWDKARLTRRCRRTPLLGPEIPAPQYG